MFLDSQRQTHYNGSRNIQNCPVTYCRAMAEPKKQHINITIFYTKLLKLLFELLESGLGAGSSVGIPSSESRLSIANSHG